MSEAKPAAPESAVAAFVARWSHVGAAERANYALFLTQLCEILDVPPPEPASDDTEHNAYVFERAVPLHQRDGKTTTGRIDLYKRGSFVLEAKQYAERTGEQDTLSLAIESAPAKKSKIARGSNAWDDAMIKARGQAENYARNLPSTEPTPPFLLVVDVGHVFELYADFSQQGKAYLPFPDARANRIRLADLRDKDVRAKLRAIWLEPLTLDPAKVSAAVTREVARYLAELAKLFEKKHDPATVATFLSRCLFCMFAEDVDLLPRDSFTHLLESVKGDPAAAVPLLKGLFDEMNRGGYSLALRHTLLHFNGGLFSESTVLPLDGTALGLLIDAAKKDWKHVEPAIFGTLLERALNPDERHKLGAHYTPRAYVERLVLPTLVEPLREEWSHVRAAAVTLAGRGDLKAAIKETRGFHHRLCAVRVLDPACGSGNFLYVALEHLKRLEGEVLQLIEAFGENMRLDLGGETVDPHQFLGIELNPRAATIAELVLWIGYLQWHHRNRGATEWPEPVLRAFKNIECRDAVLAYDGSPTAAKNPDGSFLTRWDGKTHKVDSVSGREIPDESSVAVHFNYSNPKPTKWPEADFIVGNPPFIGTRRMRLVLGDGYVEALTKAYPDVAENADFVMYWWHHAAKLVGAGTVQRFGLITTNSIRQSFNRRVVEPRLTNTNDRVSLIFAIPDHPWVDETEGAAVRIAMTVGVKGEHAGQLTRVLEEIPRGDGSLEIRTESNEGTISADLTTGASAAETKPLQANADVAYWGVKFYGDGFILTPDEAAKLRKSDGGRSLARPFVSGRDLTSAPRGLLALDCDSLDEESLRQKFPGTYDHLLVTVKPVREHNPRAFKRERWWIFGENQPGMRRAANGLRRTILTTETAKHRIFQFGEAPLLAEGTVNVIALDDAFHLGVLSSHIHVVYALAAGGTLEDRPRYNKTRCFDPFPFPDCTEKQKETIRALAEELDAQRKRAQAQHGIGLTDLYNVLEKVRASATLNAKEKLLHDQAFVSTLRQLHDDLNAAVAAAYGWPWPLPDAEILERVVALNTARAAEEAKGIVRWLRPDYQKPLFAGEKQSALGLNETVDSKSTAPKKAKAPARKKTAWPSSLADRVRAVEQALATEEKPATAAELTSRFSRAKAPDILEILQTLVTLGRARPGDEKGTFVR